MKKYSQELRKDAKAITDDEVVIVEPDLDRVPVTLYITGNHVGTVMLDETDL